MSLLTRLLLSGLLASLLLPACASAPAEASLGVVRRGDREAIEKLLERRTLVTNRGDANAFAGLFTDDAIIMPTNRTNIVGTKAIKQWEQAFAEEHIVESELFAEEITLLGNWAYVRIRVSGSLTARLGGDPVSINGKELAVMQRQADGTWKISRLMGNSNISTSRTSLNPLR